jgi:membrane-associated phospholipid phosphatase
MCATSRWIKGTLPALALAPGFAIAGDDHRRAGDVLRYALPAGVVARELWRRDDEGLWQLGQSWAVTILATEALKRTTHVERPDRSDDLSFPSRHASDAFAAATYMHRRHGIDQAWPWYAAATYVGWTRVQSNRHRWVDIAGSAALASASSWWLVSPAGGPRVSVVPMLAPGQFSVAVHTSW